VRIEHRINRKNHRRQLVRLLGLLDPLIRNRVFNSGQPAIPACDLPFHGQLTQLHPGRADIDGADQQNMLNGCGHGWTGWMICPGQAWRLAGPTTNMARCKLLFEIGPTYCAFSELQCAASSPALTMSKAAKSMAGNGSSRPFPIRRMSGCAAPEAYQGACPADTQAADRRLLAGTGCETCFVARLEPAPDSPVRQAISAGPFPRRLPRHRRDRAVHPFSSK